MGLTGDTAKLEALAQSLKKASSTDFMRTKFGDELKAAAFDEYQESFSSQRAPFGDGWPQSPHHMVLTGALSNPAVQFKGTELEVHAGSYVSIFHQAGWQTGGERVAVKGSTKRDDKGRFSTERRTIRVGGTQAGPARPMLPTKNSAGLWEKPLQSVIDKAVTEFFSSF